MNKFLSITQLPIFLILISLVFTGQLSAQGNGERVAVIFSETIDGQPDSTGIAENFIIETLLEKGYDVIDPQQSRQVLAEVGFDRIYRGEIPDGVASFNADFILVGKVDSSFAGQVPGGWFGYLSDIQAKLISVSTAKIVLASSTEGNGVDVTKSKSARLASRKGAEKLLAKFLPKMVISITDAPKNVVLLINNVKNRSQVSDIMKKLKGVNGVVRVRPPSTMSGKVTRLDMQVSGYDSIFEFSGILEEAGFTVARTDGDRIEIHAGQGGGLASFTETPFERQSGKKVAYLELRDLKVADIMPVKFRYYAGNPVAEVTVINPSDIDASNVTVELSIPKFTNLPSQKTLAKLEAGEEQLLQFPITFDNDALFSVEENTPVQAEMKVSFNNGSAMQSVRMIVGLNILSRNAIDWDEEQPIVGFITQREKVLDTFTKQVISALGEEGVNDPLYRPMALFDALAALQIIYVKDPNSALAERTLDSVQYPRETLIKKTGDCDDMSVLFASVLENIGVRTMLLTSPGHVFMAFDSGMSPAQADMVSFRNSDYFEHNGSLWIPIEATAIKEGFAEAWNRGAEEYNRAKYDEQLGQIEVAVLQQNYPSVPLPASRALVKAPPKSKILAKINSCKMTLSQVMQVAQNERLEKFKSEAESGDESAIAQYGALLAQLGRPDEAEQQFQILVDEGEEGVGYNNLGNLALLQGEYDDAVDYYEKAEDEVDDEDSLNFNMGLAYFLQEDGDAAAEYFSECNFDNNPQLSSKMQMLDQRQAGRGADKVSKVYLNKLRGLLSRIFKKKGGANAFAVAGVRGSDTSEMTELKYLVVWMQ
jgi:tetratricopeptide (TPR) repeat protein